MAKSKRKLTAAEKLRRAQFMTIFINGKQKRVRRPVLIDGLDPAEFYLQNADPVALHQDGMWELILETAADADSPTDADGIPF